MMIEPNQDAVQLKRTFAAPVKTVFDAWTNAGYVTQWLRPADEFRNECMELDVRPGGCYRFRFTDPDGTVSVVGGEFHVVDPPHKLVYSWEWESPHEHEGVQSQVTVEFRDCGNGTELILTHERLVSPGMPEQHCNGWTGALDLLHKIWTT